MRILLAHNSLYFPSHGGGDKSNRLLMEALAARGHEVRVVARIEHFSAAHEAEFVSTLRGRGVEPAAVAEGAVRFARGGVDVHTVTSTANLRGYFAAQIEQFDPDVILTSTDDPAQLLLEAALKAARARVVYLIRATIAVPFGPDSAFASAARTETLRQVDGAVGVSHYVAGYVRQWSGIPAVHVPISLLEPGQEFHDLGDFRHEFILMVNPCAVKGITIFTGLADRLPHLSFAAIPTWGTSKADLAELRARPNITLLDPVDDIEVVLRRTRVVLVPSVWAEARSRMVVEAMVRGIPVVASDVGGLHEAKLGVPYLVPVQPITHYQARVDEHMVPVADVPPQNLTPWVDVVTRLTSDEAHYGEIARESRRAALQYLEQLTAEPLERYLAEVVARPQRPRQAAARPSALERLSPEQRRVLALKLQQRAKAVPESPWFAGSTAAAEGRLICFPHAGGGTLHTRAWREALPAGWELIAIRLPGRESRRTDPLPGTLLELVRQLAEAWEPLREGPAVWFGHSMGAIVAFELARELRRRGWRLPERLIASGARSPVFRLGHQPPPRPSDAAFLEQVRRLEGMPADVLDQPDVLSAVLPALRVDADLYREYVYEPAPALAVPVHAWGGAQDPNVTREHLAAWSGVTTQLREVRQFAGGHFYLQNSAAFREALGNVLGAQ